MNIRCAKDVYKHYGIEFPRALAPRKEQRDALRDIAKDEKYAYWALGFLRFLEKEDTDIYEVIAEDRYAEMLKSFGSRGGRARTAFLYIFPALCYKYNITRLALELSVFPDIQKMLSYYDLDAVERGLAELLLGIYPFSFLKIDVQRSIIANCEIPLQFMPLLRRYYEYYRTRKIDKSGIEVDNSTLCCIHSMIRQLIRNLKVTKWQVFDGTEGALLLINYFEAKRTRKLRHGFREYQLKRGTTNIKYIKVFFRTMWKEMGLSMNPFEVKDPKDPSPDLQKRTILDTIHLPNYESKYMNTQTEYGQKRVRLLTKDEQELFISPCFEESEYIMLGRYIHQRAASVNDGKIDNLSALTLGQLWTHLLEWMGDFALAFGLLNGPRPVDYVATNNSQLGEYDKHIGNPINKRFYTSVVTVINNVRLAPNKIRPEKRFIGDVFTIFAYCQLILERITKLSGRAVRSSKYPFMINKGIPSFVDRMYRRPEVRTITRQYKFSLIRAGIAIERAQIATLYWLRKSFITFARKWGMSIEHISQITGTDPRTLYKFYVQLNMIKDTNEKFVNLFLPRLGMKPNELVIEPEMPDIPQDPSVVNVLPCDIKTNDATGEAKDEDMCGLAEATEMLGFSSAKLKIMVDNGLIKGHSSHNRWVFSRRSISDFKEKYIDADKVAMILSQNKRNRISKRWALKIMITTLKRYTIKIGNKYFTELIPVLKLAQSRKGLELCLAS